MMRALVVSMALSLIVPALAVAQGPDTIGLWFDEDYTVNVAPLVLYQPFQAHLVLHEPSADAVAGLAFSFSLSDPAVFLLATAWLEDPTVQVVDGCAFIGYLEPRPAAAAIHVATYTFLVISWLDSVVFSVTACPGEACPFYVAGDLETRYCLDTTLGDGWVACMGDCYVGNDAVSWSAVKGLYR